MILFYLASKKSRYIQKAYDAATTAERILLKQKDDGEQHELAAFTLSYKNVGNNEKLPTPLPNDILRKITFIEQTVL
jgi:hypothetical protein